jgi:hypothetical protein
MSIILQIKGNNMAKDIYYLLIIYERKDNMNESKRKHARQVKNKRHYNKFVFKASSIICLMLFCGMIGYLISTNEIKGSYDKIAVIVNDRDGVGFEELSRTFLPDLNTQLGMQMIKAANGYVSDDITFLKGQKVKIPSKDSIKLWVTDRVIMMNH